MGVCACQVGSRAMQQIVAIKDDKWIKHCMHVSNTIILRRMGVLRWQGTHAMYYAYR